MKSTNPLKVAHYSFFSFKVISDCYPRVVEILLEDNKKMKLLFSLIGENKDENITSRGYF